jgi:WRKY transcription factor 33
MSTSSFSDLLTADVNPLRSGRLSGVPKFKSVPPPSLPISPPSYSPSYFSIPPGLSPADLLDSPVLLNSSNILPSPTTGSFPFHAFNWKSNSINNQQGIKEEKKNFSDFSFPSQERTSLLSATDFQSESNKISTDQQSWNHQEPIKNTVNYNSNSNGHNNNNSSQSIRDQKRSEDGYNWRKYGQKQVKGSENPRSYYKCTHPSCPTKKKVERSIDGQITEIVYKGSHNHPMPQSTRRSSSAAPANSHSQAINPSSINEQENSYVSNGNGPLDSAATPENSSISVDDEFDQTSQRSRSMGGDENHETDEDEPDSKRWKRESENEGVSAPGSRTVREPRVVVQTTSDIDILDDGYRWRKYGQKVVKGNPNPRSYYKCTSQGCPVRKHVERASHDLRAVITTYEGKHNHEVPAARGGGAGGGSSISRPNAMAIRPSPIPVHQTNINPIRSYRQPPQMENEAPFTLEMLQSPASFGFSGFGNPMESFINQSQELQDSNNGFSRAKDEPRDDLFIESLLC